MLDPLLYRWSVAPVVIRSVHWTMQREVLQTLITSQSPAIVMSCDRPSNLTQIGFKSSIFQPVWPWNLMDDLEKQWGTSSILHQALCIISNPSVNSNWSYRLETLNSGQIWWFLSRITLKFGGWPWKTIGHLFCYFKLCASFQNHGWIQTGVTVWKHPIWIKNQQFFVPVTLKFDGWFWKRVGQFFYTRLSFGHHFKAIGEFILELQSGNAQFGCPHLGQWPMTYLMTLSDWTMSCQPWPPRARYGQWARYK